MTIDQFEIGKEFYLHNRYGYAKWRCTDKGSRVIVGFCLDEHADDPSWFRGPPYAVAEHVIDEDSMNVCYVNKPA